MTTATLTKFDLASIIATMSNVELHNCLASVSVNKNLADETIEMMRSEARKRDML